MSKKISFKIDHILYGSNEKVFEALTNPSLIEQWSGGKAVFELADQGQVELFDGWVKGTVLSYQQGKSLSYTWKPFEWKAAARASVVEMMLKKHPAGTEIILTHEGFTNQKEADNHKEGWISFVLDPLNDYLIK